MTFAKNIPVQNINKYLDFEVYTEIRVSETSSFMTQGEPFRQTARSWQNLKPSRI